MNEEEKLKIYETALMVLAGWENMPSGEWREKFPEESLRIRSSFETDSVMSDIAWEALNKAGVKM